jgi:glycosyltransferase involved in cell wall biosynthesis
MASPPLLTVFSLCYNTGTYVIEGLESFLGCGFDDYQLIVLDDHSIDNSANKVSSWLQLNVDPDKYIFIRHERNMGICKSLNEVLSLSQGSYFTGICDDKWEANRLDDMVFFNKEPDIGLLFSNPRIMDSHSQLTGDLFGNSKYLLWIDENNYFLPELNKGNFICPASCIYNTALIRRLGAFDEELSFEDWDMFIRIARSGSKIRYVDRNTVHYRQHENSFWQSRSKSLFVGLIDLFIKHSLFKESDSFVYYIEHFATLPLMKRLEYLVWLSVNHSWRIFAVVLFIFLKAPSRVRYFAYRSLFLPNQKLWSTFPS